MQKLGRLDDAYMAAKTMQSRLREQYKASGRKDRGVEQRLDQIDKRLDKLEPYHDKLTKLRRIYRKVREERREPDPDYAWIRKQEREMAKEARELLQASPAPAINQ
jgi:chromosome segregation ATPase